MPRARRIAPSCFFLLHIAFSPQAMATDPSADLTSKGNRHTLALILSKAEEHSRDRIERQLDVEAAQAIEGQIRGTYGPKLTVDANAYVWNKELMLSFGSSGAGAAPLPDPQTPYEEAMQGLLAGFSNPNPVRERMTSSVNLTLNQPISPLYATYLASSIQRLRTKVAALREKDERRTATYNAFLGYLRVGQARRQIANAAETIVLLKSQRAKAASMERNALIGTNDLLKLDIAVAIAEQQRIRAAVALDSAVAALALLINTNINGAEELSDLQCSGEPPAGEMFDSALDKALRQRLEFHTARSSVEAAEIGKSIAKVDLTPNLSAVGTYQHQEGSRLQQADAFFGGLMLSWKIFDWGTTSKKIEEAGILHRRAQLAADRLKDAVGLEVRRTLLEYDAELKALKVAKLATTQAEEAARIEERKFAQGVSVVADLIESQTTALQQKNALAVISFEVLNKRAALLKAMGDDLSREMLLQGGVCEEL